jgi:hypothetical protein
MALEAYHTGIVVPDLDEAIPAWEKVTGTSWGLPYRGPLPVRLAEEDRTVTVDIAMAYSRDLSLELVQRIPGTPWELAGGGTGVHHTGCWADDLEADSARLAADGWPLVAHGTTPEGGMVMFTYHRIPGSSTLLELVDRSTREMLEAMVRGELS